MSLLTVKEIDRAIADLFPEYQYGQPLYNTSSTENEAVFEVYAAGALREEVKIEVKDNRLSVNVEPKTKSVFAKQVNVYWNLPKDCDLDAINAKLENGVLTIRVARIKPVKKSINVAVN